MKVAISGKGGSGKTFLAGTLARAFSREGYRTLAVDADTSPNIGLSLGLTPAELRAVIPISENMEIIGSKTGTEYPGVYRLHFPVDDVVRKAVIPTPEGPGLLVMGTVRSMGAGCACPAHTLVREVLHHLVMDRDDVVIMDMEAGVEHLGRGTAASVDIMLVVSDATVRSLEAAGNIIRLAAAGGIPSIGLVGNRVMDRHQEEVLTTAAGRMGVGVMGMIPYDPVLAEAEVSGVSRAVPADSPAQREVERIMTRIHTMVRKKDGPDREG